MGTRSVMKSAVLLVGCVVLACFISTEALNKDESIMKAYMEDQEQHKSEEMVAEPPPVDTHQYTKFPSWVESEKDMELYFKRHNTKVIRRDTGNGGINPSGNPTIEAELVQEWAPPSEVKKAREDKYRKQ